MPPGISGAGRLFSVYNGADMDAPRSKMRREDFLAAHGIPAAPGDILAGTAARFDAVKDLSTMLRGFAAAAKEEPQLRLILAGAGAEEEMLRALAKELGVSDRVHFTGWLDDTEALYASLDICLLTSLSETFPYALTDAAKYRVPVIATAVGGVPELVENGVHGLLIAPGDTAALASDILTLSRDPALREKLGTALRDRTAKKFSLSAMALREKEICRAVLSPRREIVIAGAYGCGNRGDELMLENLLRDGRAAAPECAVTVLSHRPKETARRFDVDSLYYLNVPGDPPKNEERPRARLRAAGICCRTRHPAGRLSIISRCCERESKAAAARSCTARGLARSRRAAGPNARRR